MSKVYQAQETIKHLMIPIVIIAILAFVIVWIQSNQRNGVLLLFGISLGGLFLSQIYVAHTHGIIAWKSELSVSWYDRVENPGWYWVALLTYYLLTVGMIIFVVMVWK